MEQLSGQPITQMLQRYADLAARPEQEILLNTSMVPVITPLRKNALGEVEVDQESARTYFEYLYQVGVRAVFVVGTTGEFFAMPTPLRQRAIKVLTKEARRAGLIVLANITAESEGGEIIENARIAREAGAHGFVTVPLYYLQNEEEIERHIRELKLQLRAQHIDLPLLLYNIPMLHKKKVDGEGVDIPAPVVGTLWREKLIAGIKDTSLDSAQTLAFIQSGAITYTGNPLTAAQDLEVGARGVVSVTAAAGLKADVDLPTAATPAERASRQAAMAELFPILVGSWEAPRIQPRIKFALVQKGIIAAATVANESLMPPLEESERERVLGVIGRLGPVPAVASGLEEFGRELLSAGPLPGSLIYERLQAQGSVRQTEVRFIRRPGDLPARFRLSSQPAHFGERLAEVMHDVEAAGKEYRLTLYQAIGEAAFQRGVRRIAVIQPVEPLPFTVGVEVMAKRYLIFDAAMVPAFQALQLDYLLIVKNAAEAEHQLRTFPNLSPERLIAVLGPGEDEGVYPTVLRIQQFVQVDSGQEAWKQQVTQRIRETLDPSVANRVVPIYDQSILEQILRQSGLEQNVIMQVSRLITEATEALAATSTSL